MSLSYATLLACLADLTAALASESSVKGLKTQVPDSAVKYIGQFVPGNADVDSYVLCLLRIVHTQGIRQVQQDFQLGPDTTTRLWYDWDKKLLDLYVAKVQVFADAAVKRPVEYRKAYDRLLKVCQAVADGHREMIVTAIKSVGSCAEVDRILPVLKTIKQELSEVDLGTVKEAQKPGLLSVVSIAAGALGDVSRYRSQLNYLRKPKNSRDIYQHATIYYLTGVNVDPANGLSYVKLGITSRLLNDMFNAFYWFCKGSCLERRCETAQGNMTIALKKIAKLSDEDLLVAGAATVITTAAYNPAESDPSHFEIQAVVTMLKIVRTYADYQYSSDTKRAAIIAELTRYISGRHIPRGLLLRLGIIGIALTHLAETAHKNAEMRLEYERLALDIFDAVTKVALTFYNDGKSGFVYDLIPSLRVYVAWMTRKVVPSRSDVGELRPQLIRLNELLDVIRDSHGFSFDPEYAVGRFINNSSTWVLSAEERECLGLAPLDGGLSDFPSGVDKGPGSEFAAQCLLCSGIELNRLELGVINFDCSKRQFTCTTEDVAEEDDDDEVMVFEVST